MTHCGVSQRAHFADERVQMGYARPSGSGATAPATNAGLRRVGRPTEPRHAR